jgi:hypothetical protein
MRKQTEILLLLGLIAFFVLVVVLSHREGVDLTQAHAAIAQRSSYRTMPEGYKALYLTLEKLGYPVHRQTRAFNELPPAGGLLIVADPFFRRTMALKEGEELTSWLRQGNHALVALEYHAEFLYGMLGSEKENDAQAQRAELDQMDGTWFREISMPKLPVTPPIPMAPIVMPYTTAKPIVPSFLAEQAPKLDTYSYRRFQSDIPLTSEQIDRIGSVVPLYQDGKGVVVAYSAVGQGGIVWCASPWSFSNAGLSSADNLAFVLALANLKPGAPVIFDEYHQGFGNKMTVWSLLPKLAKLGVLQLAAALLLLFLTLAWRFGPAQLPEEERFSRSRAEYLTAMAALLERARATHVVRERLSVLLRRELARRLGVPPQAPAERFLTANAGHAVVDQDQLERVLRLLIHMEGQKRPDPEALLRLAGEMQRMLHQK